MPRLLMPLIAAGVLAAGLHWGTFAVGGSDSYCYVHQAEIWLSGHLRVPEPLALEAPWPDAAMTFAPAGHVPSPTVRGAPAPVCPSGLSIFMAPFLAIGGVHGMFLVVPLFGALLVLATYLVGARFGKGIGIASALLIACSPVFLFQLVQPMSDVPAAALWVLAVVFAMQPGRRSVITSGLVTSAAILVRPNLLPLGLTIGLFFLLRRGSVWPARVRVGLIYAACCVPGCIAVAAIQQTLYGSPFRSGYGSLEGLFAIEHVASNAPRYLGWLWESHSPAWILALTAPIVLPGPMTSFLLGLFLVNLACYLPYAVFDDWSYLRFLLPTLPMLIVLMVAVLDAICRRALSTANVRLKPDTTTDDVRLRPDTTYRYVVSAFRRTNIINVGVVTAATVALAVLFLSEARDRSVFNLHRLEARYVKAGTFVAERLPSNALVITSWESGSVRFYSGRRTLVWDSLDPAWLDRALTFVRSRGFEPYLLFERWEEPSFRRRFAGSDVGALDWPPIAEIASQVRVYRPEDRQRYQAGAAVATEYVR